MVNILIVKIHKTCAYIFLNMSYYLHKLMKIQDQGLVVIIDRAKYKFKCLIQIMQYVSSSFIESLLKIVNETCLSFCYLWLHVNFNTSLLIRQHVLFMVFIIIILNRKIYKLLNAMCLFIH